MASPAITKSAITRAEWERYWLARRELTLRLTLRRKQLNVLKEAEREMEKWEAELLAKVKAGAEAWVGLVLLVGLYPPQFLAQP